MKIGERVGSDGIRILFNGYNHFDALIAPEGDRNDRNRMLQLNQEAESL